ncbi:cell division protein ZipA C-terminal FtsZ-binding domain-containing protein [Gammaproteobacteria bacterium]|nr:cell division protein ZipA C-terminal FtsZ-binding domain-containing protein [Gammaproteobacteria bacterium]MDB9907476.1 cell division protein ZipA C-terminal FtsZ-binding domain-containing protein [Gammaproteobacteria bacterium]MDC0089871.1 cell division protein ZipA C-terminal FtsZ-binding domain-containing protein [Gammaproteobacteria bacterium]
MISNSEVFLIVAALLAFLLILYIFFKQFFTRKLSQTNIQDSESILFDGNPEQGTLGFDESDDHESIDQALIILNLISMDKSNFDIDQVLMLFKNLDARHVDGFLSFRDESGTEIFRVASGINPGVLELDTRTHILFMALDLYQVRDPLKGLEKMLDAATNISEKLHASICDQNRAPLSKQMIEHYKSKAQEISHIQSMRKSL